MSDYAPRYPLLEALLAQLGLVLKGRYRLSDAVQIFGVSRRSIQDWVRDGKLNARNLGQYRFLSEDLETCLQTSAIKRQPRLTKQTGSDDLNPPDQVQGQTFGRKRH